MVVVTLVLRPGLALLGSCLLYDPNKRMQNILSSSFEQGHGAGLNRRWRCTCEPEANQKRLATNPSGSDTFPVLLQFNQGEKEKLPAWLVTMGRGGSEARSSMSLLVNHTMSLYVLVRRSVPHLFPKNVQTDDELMDGWAEGA